MLGRSVALYLLLSELGAHGRVQTQDEVLQGLLYSARYSGDTRPKLAIANAAGACDADPDEVVLQMSIVEISKVDQRKQSYEFNAHLMLSWDDERLVFNESDCSAHALILTSAHSHEAIWKPSMYFEHAISVNIPSLGMYQGDMIRVNQHGHVEWTRQARVHLHCGMGFGRLPFDNQECVMVAGIYADTAGDVRLTWAPGDHPLGKHLQDIA